MSDPGYSFHLDDTKIREVVQVPCTSLSSGTKLVFIDLLSHSKGEYCHRSQRKIAEDVGISERQVRSHIKRLTSLHIIGVVKENGSSAVDLSRVAGTNTYDLSSVFVKNKKRKEAI